uniref:hypothetical protein n=2 Tax=unclassified Phenylobacterium TaxID=2640670 RepID=UPI00083A5443
MKKDMSAEYPHLERFWPYLDLLHKESDRGKVLISTGFMEEQLKDVLLASMRKGKVANDLLTSGNAPLGTFSSRISACFALGFVTDDEHHDLTLVRRIRNDFAHGIHTTFDTPSVVDRCRQLRLKAVKRRSKGTPDRRRRGTPF